MLWFFRRVEAMILKFSNFQNCRFCDSPSSILASLNLPAALDDVTNQEALPESIRQKSSKVKTYGGIDAITSLIADLPNIQKRNQEILDEVSFSCRN